MIEISLLLCLWGGQRGGHIEIELRFCVIKPCIPNNNSFEENY